MILDPSAENITWISPQSLILLRDGANTLPLNNSKIHARQGGNYLSSFKGRGMEFDESRLYMPGDDIRNMDWRVTARTGTAHTKVFREERERPVLLWLDLNSSMFFATRGSYKAVVAARIAALIGWSVTSNNDRLGGLIFSTEQHSELRPRRGKAAVLDFIGQCCKHPAWDRGQTPDLQHQPRNMTVAVSRLRKVAHPGSLVFLLSDFREMDPSAWSHLANIARHSDVVLIQISDPIETQLPHVGSYRVSSGQTVVQINAFSKTTQQRYHEKAEQRYDTLQHFCRQHRIFLLSISTADDTLTQLQHGLGIRAAGNRARRRMKTK